MALGDSESSTADTGGVSWSPLPLPSKAPSRHLPFCQDLLPFVKAFQPLGGETPPLFPGRWANPKAQSFPQGLRLELLSLLASWCTSEGLSFLSCSYFIHGPDKLLTLKFLSQVCLLGYPKLWDLWSQRSEPRLIFFRLSLHFCSLWSLEPSKGLTGLGASLHSDSSSWLTLLTSCYHSEP